MDKAIRGQSGIAPNWGDSINCFVCDKSYSLHEPWVILNRYICRPQRYADGPPKCCYGEAVVQICRYCAARIGEVPVAFTFAMQIVASAMRPLLASEKWALMQYLRGPPDQTISLPTKPPPGCCVLCHEQIRESSQSIKVNVETHQKIVWTRDADPNYGMGCGWCDLVRVEPAQLDGYEIERNRVGLSLVTTKVLKVCEVCERCSAVQWGVGT